jgi:hypothetical protein
MRPIVAQSTSLRSLGPVVRSMSAMLGFSALSPVQATAFDASAAQLAPDQLGNPASLADDHGVLPKSVPESSRLRA